MGKLYQSKATCDNKAALLREEKKLSQFNTFSVMIKKKPSKT